MKKPIFNEWDRVLIRDCPDSLMALRFEVMKAKRDIGNELYKILKPILPYSHYIAIGCFIVVLLIVIFAEPV